MVLTCNRTWRELLGWRRLYDKERGTEREDTSAQKENEDNKPGDFYWHFLVTEEIQVTFHYPVAIHYDLSSPNRIPSQTKRTDSRLLSKTWSGSRIC